MRIAALDHLVLTVRDVDVAIAFYVDVLGMKEVAFGAGRRALAFGRQKINLHLAGSEFAPHAKHPVPGSADLCFLIEGTLAEAAARLAEHGVGIEEGPVRRTGAGFPIDSIYLRDPDGNLLELSVQAAAE